MVPRYNESGVDIGVGVSTSGISVLFFQRCGYWHTWRCTTILEQMASPPLSNTYTMVHDLLKYLIAATSFLHLRIAGNVWQNISLVTSTP